MPLDTLWDEQEEFLKATSKTIAEQEFYKGEKIVEEIHKQIREIQRNHFEPEFIIMNSRNYERIVAWGIGHGLNGVAPDKLFGLTLVVWDVPVDYVNVRCKASVEWSYGEGIRKQ